MKVFASLKEDYDMAGIFISSGTKGEILWPNDGSPVAAFLPDGFKEWVYISRHKLTIEK
jgi:hypothetical protein